MPGDCSTCSIFGRCAFEFEIGSSGRVLVAAEVCSNDYVWHVAVVVVAAIAAEIASETEPLEARYRGSCKIGFDCDASRLNEGQGGWELIG